VRSDLFRDKKLFVFDMDGTLYLGGRLLPGSVDYINLLHSSGKRVVFFTNNTSRSKSEYAVKLARMGFSEESFTLYSAADVTLKFLTEQRRGSSVFVLGTPSLAEFLENGGVSVVNQKPEKPDIVLVGFDTALTYENLARACSHIRGGAEYLATHPDINCPTEAGDIPDCAAICALISLSCGKPVPRHFGKPSREALDFIKSAAGTVESEMVIFGDRLYTDIALGKNHGVTSVLVLSGETKAADLLRIEDKRKPDYVFDGLYELVNK